MLDRLAAERSLHHHFRNLVVAATGAGKTVLAAFDVARLPADVPERADGLDMLHWFDGRIAAELRLWSALDQGLLAPFHYVDST